MQPSRAQVQVFSCNGSAVWLRWDGSEVAGGDAGEEEEEDGVGGRWAAAWLMVLLLLEEEAAWSVGGSCGGR